MSKMLQNPKPLEHHHRTANRSFYSDLMYWGRGTIHLHQKYCAKLSLICVNKVYLKHKWIQFTTESLLKLSCCRYANIIKWKQTINLKYYWFQACGQVILTLQWEREWLVDRHASWGRSYLRWEHTESLPSHNHRNRKAISVFFQCVPPKGSML